MFNLLLFVILIKVINSVYKKYDIETEVFKYKRSQSGNLLNYYPLVFHMIISGLLIVSLFSESFFDDNSIHTLMQDISFQIYSTLLLIVVSLINPFLPLSTDMQLKFQQMNLNEANKYTDWLTKGYNWQLLKALLCVIIVFATVAMGYLELPSLNGSVISGVVVALIVFSILGNLIQLFKNPKLFRNLNIFRFRLLLNSVLKSLYILIPTLIVMLILEPLKIKLFDILTPTYLMLVVYNVVMVFNEYGLLKLEESYANKQL